MMGQIAEARVTRARVYLNGCVITCAGTMNLSRGDNTVLVDCVAFNAVEDSLRVRLPAGITLVSVGIANDGPKDKLDQESCVEECRRTVARIDERIKNRTTQKELWLSRAKSEQLPQGGLSDVAAYLEALPARLDTLDDELAELRRERDRANEQLIKAQKELNDLRNRSMRGLLHLRVTSDTEGIVPFEVDQRCNHAFWKPVYDVIVDGFDAPVSLRMRAEVSQQTALDWKGVQLTLSTARSSASGTLPKLSPLRLRRHREIPLPAPQRRPSDAHLSAQVSAPMMAAKARAGDTLGDTNVDLLPLPSAPLVEAQASQAESNVLASSVEFSVGGTWDVPTDKDSCLVEVQTTRIDAAYEWHAVPAVDNDVYMVAVLEKALPPEAAGQTASVYLMGEYCGKVVLDAPSTGKKPEISLGPDRRMRASRTLASRKDSSQLLRGRVLEQTTFELGVLSQRDEAVRLVLIDQIPVSEDKEIVVEQGDCTGALVDAESGELRWEIDLAQNASCKRRFSYTVSHPRDFRVDKLGGVGRFGVV